MEFPAHVYHRSVHICQAEDSQLRLLATFRQKVLLYCVPLGSVLGSILFALCIQPLSNLIKRHSLGVHLFADGIQIEASALPQHVHSAISSVETCIYDV